ncbi:MAG: DHH family phosphoesterase [Candidatus Heimdallarchaeota archaeon]|nr:DHH family phosphoesterase [Candidatus Heimdallarchaeota archaeon]MCK5048195.1 DHH family phosphoesterase [Candidatus Heimdallarchaeota archaeon]
MTSSVSFKEIYLSLVEPRVEDENIIITSHVNADPDAVGSAYALGNLLERYNLGKPVYIFPKVNATGKILADKLGINWIDYSSDKPSEEISTILAKTAAIILVDSSSSLLAASFEFEQLPFLVIDHHTEGDLVEKANWVNIDSEYTSTCEMIAEYWLTEKEESGMEIPDKVQQALLAGTLYDSRRFYNISPKTFEIVNNLISNIKNYTTANSLLQTEMDRSETKARLKAFSRAQLYDFQTVQVVVSFASAFEASIARGLISYGADIAFVVNLKKTLIRASVRGKNAILNKYKLDLGRFMEEFASELGGVGGGHFAAAGMNVEKKKEATITVNEIIKKFTFKMEQKIKESIARRNRKY